MGFPKQEIVKKLKEQYPSGSRVKLIHLDDPYRDIPVGTKGTVENVDDTGTIHVAWDGGCRLGVVYGEDSCEKLQTVTTVCYGREDVFDCRDDAINFFMEAVAGSEGSERERYQNILWDLSEGKDVCTDGEG